MNKFKKTKIKTPKILRSPPRNPNRNPRAEEFNREVHSNWMNQ